MSSHNGSSNGKVVPAAFPPPVDSPQEFVKRGLDPEDELIEVGVAIVGGGTAGLACANRLLQLLADDPEPLKELFPDMTREQWRAEGFAFGEVTKEAVYLTPTAKHAIRIPTPPPFKNHGNEVISVSALARYQQKQVEDAGAYILTETAA